MSGRRQKHTRKRILPESFLREDDGLIYSLKYEPLFSVGVNVFLMVYEHISGFYPSLSLGKMMYEPLFSVGVNVFLMVYEPISGICWGYFDEMRVKWAECIQREI
ncbi:hypothetical protein ACS0TY_020671 [Phlomoides rotata]